jgi:hypothetical protein
MFGQEEKLKPNGINGSQSKGKVRVVKGRMKVKNNWGAAYKHKSKGKHINKSTNKANTIR